jgi:uncharacterized protein YdaU (DUF1376 family)
MSFAYMRLYTGDYQRDTQHLSCSEHGIYLKLLMHCWDQKGPAPLDERRLVGIVNARSGDEIEALRRVLSEFFTKMEDGWYNKRMAEEIAFSDHIAHASSEGGKRSAEIRQARSNMRKISRIEGTLKAPSTILEGALVSPSPSPSPKEKTNTRATALHATAGFPAFWDAYPKRKGKQAALQAYLKLQPAEDLQAQILRAVKAAKSSDEWKRDNGRYIPLPASYLNGRRWEDEQMSQEVEKNWV